jgi:myo-inositol-1(or 4)-monophosphatase
MSDDLFTSQLGKGSFYNGEAIHVSDSKNLLASLVVTGFPYFSDKNDEVISRFCKILEKAQGVRRLGSAALDLCYVARGFFDDTGKLAEPLGYSCWV